MVRELNIEDAVYLGQAISQAIRQGAPIKTPLYDAQKAVQAEVKGYTEARDQITEKYLKKDEDGNPIPKDTTTIPELVTDFVNLDEEGMIKELEALSESTVSVEIETIPADRPVIVKLEGGLSKEIPLREYLEISETCDAKVVHFLNKYFLDD